MSFARLFRGTQANGSSSSSGSGSEGGDPGNYPSGLPDSSGSNPTFAPGSYPSGTDGSSGSLPSGLPSGSPDASTCPLARTETVFVTVVPTDPGPIVSSNGAPDDENPDETAHHMSNPTQSAQVSSAASPLVTAHSVKPFTTLTIDIWGTDSGSGHPWSGSAPNDGSGSGSDHSHGPATAASDFGATAPGYTDPTEASGASPAGDSGQSGQGTVAAMSTAPFDSSGGISDSQPASTEYSLPGTRVTGGSQGPVYGTAGNSGPQGSGSLPFSTADNGDQQGSGGMPFSTGGQGPYGSSPWETVVTDSDVHWTPGPSGPTQVTILSPHTITLGEQPTNGPTGDNSGPASDGSGFRPSSCITVIGPDGKPTIVDTPGGIPTDNVQPISNSGTISGDNGQGGISTGVTLPAPTITGPVDGSMPGGAGGDGGAGTTTCTSYTVLGPDGLPTILHTTWVVPSTGASVLPTDVPFPASMPGLASGATPDNGAASSTCTSYTVLGPDGLPTVVEST